MLKKLGPALSLATLFSLAVHGISLSSEKLPNNQTIKQPSQSTHQPIQPEAADEKIAFYTEILAFFTGLLALVSSVQIVFLIRADKTARMAAEAARDGLQIARDEFTITYRPKLHVRLIRLDHIGGPQIRIHYTVVNIGQTRAFLKQHEVTLCVQAANIQQGALVECPELTAGESAIFWVSIKIDYDLSWGFAVNEEIKIRGRIEYDDAAGITRRLGFFRTYDHKLGYFRKSNETEEEYED